MGTIMLSPFPVQGKPAKKAIDKACISCPEKGVQPISHFAKNNTYLDGHRKHCKACVKKERVAKEQERKMYNGF